MRRSHIVFVFTALAVGCVESTKSGDDDSAATETGDTGDTGDTDPGFPAVDGCRAEYRDPELARTVLANLPFEGDGSDWAVLELSIEGELTDLGARVTAGAAFLGSGAFTLDGSLGVVAQDDGTLAVFEVDSAGNVTVVESGWTSGFYASAVSMHPSGERAWVVDQNTVENGGGVYAVDLSCTDGTPSASAVPVDTLGRIYAANLPAAALSVPGREDRLIVVGAQEDGADVSLLAVPAGTELDRIDAFSDDDDAWLTVADISPQGDLVLLTDTSAWSDRENAVAAISLQADILVHAGVDDLFDGVALRIGPDGTTAVASSGYADAIVRMAVDTTAPDAVTVQGTLHTDGGSPQLPGSMVSVQRGSLGGLVLVGEVYGIRAMMMGLDGDATDLGVTSGLSNPGALLVQP